MSNIYIQGLKKVEKGEKFYINFEELTLKIGNKTIIKKGVYDNSQELYEGHYDLNECIENIRKLYKIYKYSQPSERSDKKRTKYFKALSLEELTDEQLILGERREVAQYKLEAFILCAILKNDLLWDENKLGKWFYHDPIETDLVFLKQWIINN
jgi:hypothetical protein